MKKLLQNVNLNMENQICKLNVFGKHSFFVIFFSHAWWQNFKEI